MNPALISSKDMTHGTPEYFLDLVRQVGEIVYDPATSEDNRTGAESWSYQDDEFNGHTMLAYDDSNIRQSGGGLVHVWPETGLVFANPPYGRHLDGALDPHKDIIKKIRKNKRIVGKRLAGRGTGWSRKMAGHKGEGLYLVPARTETAWFRRLFGWCDMRLDWSSDTLGSRIKFVGNTEGAPFPSTVFYRGPRAALFGRVFRPHGELLPGRRFLDALWSSQLG